VLTVFWRNSGDPGFKRMLFKYCILNTELAACNFEVIMRIWITFYTPLCQRYLHQIN